MIWAVRMDTKAFHLEVIPRHWVEGIFPDMRKTLNNLEKRLWELFNRDPSLLFNSIDGLYRPRLSVPLDIDGKQFILKP